MIKLSKCRNHAYVGAQNFLEGSPVACKPENLARLDGAICRPFDKACFPPRRRRPVEYAFAYNISIVSIAYNQLITVRALGTFILFGCVKELLAREPNLEAGGFLKRGLIVEGFVGDTGTGCQCETRPDKPTDERQCTQEVGFSRTVCTRKQQSPWERAHPILANRGPATGCRSARWPEPSDRGPVWCGWSENSRSQFCRSSQTLRWVITE